MPIIRDDGPSRASAEEVLDNLIDDLIRAFVAVGSVARDVVEPDMTPEDLRVDLVLALRRRLGDFVAVFGGDDAADAQILLAEAVDNLDAGLWVDPADLFALARRL